MALIDKLTNIADAIREKTGGTALLTLDAMAEAIAGIEAGGDSAGGASGIYMAKITPAEEVGEFIVTHNLGTTDILFAGLWAETMGDVVPTTAQGIMKVWFKTDIQNVRGGYGWAVMTTWDTSNNRGGNPGQPNSSAYWCEAEDENNFDFERAGSASAKYAAGVTYTVIIMAASAFKETEG